jgi:hypothetical protein
MGNPQAIFERFRAAIARRKCAMMFALISIGAAMTLGASQLIDRSRSDRLSVQTGLLMGASTVAAKSKLFPYIYINADGSARELHATERTYLETEFAGGDGNAPNIKLEYEERNGWGDLNGYLARDRLPSGMPIASAPTEDPLKPMTRQQQIEWYRARGVELVENPDGSLTMLPTPKQ